MTWVPVTSTASRAVRIAACVTPVWQRYTGEDTVNTGAEGPFQVRLNLHARRWRDVPAGTLTGPWMRRQLHKREEEEDCSLKVVVVGDQAAAAGVSEFSRGGGGGGGAYGHRGRRTALHLGLVAAQRDLERGLGVVIVDASYAALTIAKAPKKKGADRKTTMVRLGNSIGRLLLLS